MKKHYAPALLPAALFLLLSLSAPAQWAPFTAGNTNGFIVEFAEHEGDIYACGFFTRIGGQQARYIARWNCGQWEAVGAGLPDEGHSLYSFQGGLHAAKYEWGADSNYLFRWNSDIDTWSRLGGGFHLTNADPAAFRTASLYALSEYGGQLIVAGEFDRIGADTVNGIAAWNGVAWEPLGQGFTGYIDGGPQILYPHSLVAHEGWLYAAGNFKMAGEVVANGIARWNGSAWEALGEGFNGAVYGIEIYNGELYAGGAFTRSGDNSLGLIAKWDGSEWVKPGIAIDYASTPPFPFAHTLRSIDGRLYVLGGFNLCTNTDGSDVPCGGILAFNGETWDGLDGGLSGEAEAIIPYGGGILVGGFFNQAGGVPANNMALWGVVSSTADPSDGAAIQVFPNPAREVLYVRGAAAFEYALYDMAGRLALRGQTTADAAIPLEGLPQGVYCLRVRTGKGVAVRRVVRE